MKKQDIEKTSLMNKEDTDYLTTNGYLNADGTLTKKADDLLSSVELCSTLFENSHSAKKEVVEAVSDMKKTFGSAFNALRNNTSDVLHTMADNLKAK